MAFKTRIQSKNGTEAEWDLATNFIPLKGEVIIYNTDGENTFPRIKIGDGETPVTHLSFANEEIGLHEIDEICLGYSVSDILSENSWDVIKIVAAAGTGENYWDVGDRIGITLNGTVGQLTFSNETYYAYILGFNHNPEHEGNHIHFQFGFTEATEGRNISFVDNSFGKTVSSAAFNMNYSQINSGGWNSSKMRTVNCANFLNALPSALQNVIHSCTKYSDNTGGGSNTASYVTSTSDKIFLLSEFEVFGTRSYANSAEQNYQKQYSYYANGNSKVKYKHNGTSSVAAVNWWLRSVRSVSTLGFCTVGTSSLAGVDHADYSRGFAPAFAI